MDDSEVVCFCQNVTIGMIKEAVAGGARTLEEVQEATSAGTACGGCLENVQQFVEQFVKDLPD